MNLVEWVKHKLDSKERNRRLLIDLVSTTMDFHFAKQFEERLKKLEEEVEKLKRYFEGH